MLLILEELGVAAATASCTSAIAFIAAASCTAVALLLIIFKYFSGDLKLNPLD